MNQKMKRIEPHVSVLVHNFILLKAKNTKDVEIRISTETKPLAIDLSSDEAEVHPKEIDSLFSYNRKGSLCELTDKDLGLVGGNFVEPPRATKHTTKFFTFPLQTRR